MLKSAVIEEKKFKHSPRAGADHQLGPNLISPGRPYHYGHLLQVYKESLTLYTSFHDLINVYSWRSGADNPATKFLCQQKPLARSLKKCLWSLILYNFFSWFYMCIEPQGRGWQSLGDEILMSTGTSCHFGHLLQVSKKSLWSLILYNFFHDFIHVHSPRAGTDSPQGTKFWCQQKCLVTSFICDKFQKNVFEAWFYTIFFMI